MAKPEPRHIFLILGVLLVALAAFVKKGGDSFSWKEFASSALLNVAFILLTVVIVDYLWQAMGGEPLSNLVEQLRRSTDLLEDAFRTGARRLLHSSGTFGDHGIWMDRIRRAESTLDLMGYTLYVWNKGEGFDDQIVRLVDRGVKCRVLIMSPDNEHFDAVINESIAGITKSATAGESSGARHLFQTVEGKVAELKNPKGSFEFREASKGTVLCQICRTDDSMTVIQYLYSAVAARTPIIVVEGSSTGLFRVYLEEFEAIWQLNDAS